MNWQRIRTLVEKEWAETIRNGTIVWTFVGMLVLFMLLPLGIAFGAPLIAGDSFRSDPDVDRVVAVLATLYPAIATLEPVEQFQIFMLRQFIPLFLLLPIMGALSVATYSIIGEKTSRSLEALLATPIRTDELLVAKSVAAALPAVVATWLAFALFAALTWLLGSAAVFRYALDGAAWAMILLVAPLVALLGLGAGVLVSARSNDARSAQQVGALVVLPLMALVVGQASGVLLLGLPLVLLVAAILVVVDAAVLAFGVSLFNREAILTRWR